MGAAGLLSGLKATTHWAALDRLEKWGAIPTHSRMVEDQKIITAAGVSAGIDMALHLAKKVAGDNFAKTLQLGLEYDPELPFDAGSPQKAAPEIVNKLRARLLDILRKPKSFCDAHGVKLTIIPHLSLSYLWIFFIGMFKSFCMYASIKPGSVVGSLNFLK